jgi:hypothetical protein
MNGAKYEHTQNISMQRILQVRICSGVVLSLLVLLTYLCMYVLRLLCVSCLCSAAIEGSVVVCAAVLALGFAGSF